MPASQGGEAERRPWPWGARPAGTAHGAVILLLSRSSVPFRFGTPLVPNASVAAAPAFVDS
jgi:hypothetical protein